MVKLQFKAISKTFGEKNEYSVSMLMKQRFKKKYPIFILVKIFGFKSLPLSSAV